MLGNKKIEPKFMYSVSLEDLVPQDDFYRKINEILDLRFIYKRCKSLYGKTGKPSLDPVVFLKLNLFGYFENIISNRKLIRRANDSLSARLFLGYDIDEELPWHSTISRTRALMKEELFEELFNIVVKMCADAGLIAGEHQSIDSTLVKANASLETMENRKPELQLCEYIQKTLEENKSEEEVKDNDGNGESKHQIKQIDKPSEGIKTKRSNEHYMSKTDPDCRIAKKPGKKTDLYFTTHYSVDSKNKVITDVLTTHSDIADSDSLMEIVDRTLKRLDGLGFRIESISADKNYCSGENLRNLEEQGIIPYIPTQKHPNTTGGISKDEFKYDNERDEYTCPNKKVLKYRYTTKRQARVYGCSIEECRKCPLKELCSPGKCARKVQHSIFHEEYERLKKRLGTSYGRNAMRLRKTGPEPLFGEAKVNHGLIKFMTRGLDKAQKNSFIIATVQNLKRLINSINRDKTKVLSAGENLFSVMMQNVLKRISSYLSLQY